MKLCDECNKEAAAVFLKLAVNNKVTETHLCQACAARKGMGLGFESGAFNISDIVGNMSGYFKDFLPPEKKTLRCRACGLKYSEFKESGRLGCPECYAGFGSQLAELLARIHGASRHTGRAYCGGAALKLSKAEIGRRLDELRAELKAAIAREDFEGAARLRDAMRQLEGGHG
ncbi:MAG: UvrB/UvrC motif-containing protein [Elusimicrobia bacterium]|jgi:protein arginine kinase activator|nr:UvrB/UvrC motif-containing protein [Elusimicrobiota bacterium]